MGDGRFAKRFEPQNLSELEIAEISEYGVYEWHSSKDGQGDPEMIVLMLTIEGLEDIQLGLRLKTRSAVDDLVEMLTTHRDAVWP